MTSVCGKRALTSPNKENSYAAFPATEPIALCSPFAASPASSAKRARRSAYSPPRYHPHAGEPPAGSFEFGVATLRTYFPEMDSQAVASMLEACNNNLDAAISALTRLRLASEAAPGGAAAAAAGPSSGAATPEAAAAAREAADAAEQQAAAVARGEPAGAAAADEAAARGAAERAGAAAAEAAGQAAAAAEAAAREPPTTVSTEWVEATIQAMAGAASMDDARGRAAQLLTAFERAARGPAPAAAAAEPELRAHTAALARDNSILKRAVAIQNGRQQELEREVGALRALATQQQEQLRRAELNNYSLALHLRQAGGAVSLPFTHNPDVF